MTNTEERTFYIRRVDQGLTEINKVQGHLLYLEPFILCGIASTLKKNATILEIGSWCGLSAMMFCEANPLLTVYCVDTWEGSYEHQDFDIVKNNELYSTFMENTKKYREKRRIVVNRGRSSDILPVLANEVFDFVFIDGDHGYESCLNDLNMSFKKVVKGGLIAIHDCAVGSGVEKAVLEFCTNNDIDFHVVCQPLANYLAMIRIPI